MSSSVDVLRILRALRRRMIAVLWLEKLAEAALTVSAALVLFAALNRWIFGNAPVNASVLASAACAALVLAAVGVFANRCPLSEVAAAIDARGETRDRFVSALEFSETPAQPGKMRGLAERECCEFLTRADFHPLVPVRLPASGAWLVVPVVALIFLQWEFNLADGRRRAETAAAQKAISGTVQELDQLAKQTERASEQTKSDELKKLAGELKQSVERLRAETRSEDAQKAALRELSALEAMMKEMQRQPSPAEEMKELARALSSLPGMKDVSNALDENNLAEAAKALDEAERKAGDDAQAADSEQVQQALKQAMERLAQQRQLSDALQKLMDQARKEGGGKGMTSQAMQQLRDMIRQMQRNGGDPQGGGNSQRPMTLQQLIAALQNMKFGEGPEGSSPGADAKQGNGGPQISIQQFGGAPNPQAQPQPGNANEPGGRPGSERDFGTTDTPFGAKNDEGKGGADSALKGKLADGESLSMMLPTAGDKSKAARRYKELYNAMAPAAENAVEQENIPLGSRFFIKRYFESIRPKE